MLVGDDLLQLLGDRADAALRGKWQCGSVRANDDARRATGEWRGSGKVPDKYQCWQAGEGRTSEIDPIRCSAFSAGSASHSSTLILIRSGIENTAAPAGPYAADAGLAAATASSAALPVASVGSITARLVSVPRRNEGGCGPRASASVTVKSMACAQVGGGVCADSDALIADIRWGPSFRYTL